MKVSVVIPTYRRLTLLKECLRRLDEQTLAKQDYEIIVVDDGPSEEVMRYVAELGMQRPFPEVRYACTAGRQGPAAGRNIGWRRARSPVVAFLDDDCLPEPSWLAEGLKPFAWKADAVTGRVIVPVGKHPTDYELCISRLETCEFLTANCLCRKPVLEELGGFDQSFPAAWREDSDLHFRLLKQDKVILRQASAIVVHPVRKAPWGVSLKEQRKSMFNALLFKKFPDLYRSRIEPCQPWLYYVIVLSACVAALAFMLKHDVLFWLASALSLAGIVYFTMKRLRHTSRSFGHVAEMIVTSALIPFLSVYWRVVGGVRYRVLFF